MDLSPSPPDLQNSSPEFVTDNNMAAAAVAHPTHTANMPGLAGAQCASNNGKRYRPAPAKTFQCRGYGECRMVFSRSEHLARHIRKHTGERPFSCHCSKQFSRLDNLRQHAQTVHADKQEENERMMRDLTSLHATMSAANRIGGSRAGRKSSSAANANGLTGGNNPLASVGAPLLLVKQEDLPLQHHQRPGTSTGYESGEVMYTYDNSTNPDGSRNASHSSFRDQSHSFRESSQSFLAPPNTSSATGAAPAAHSQSFLGYTGTQHHVVTDVPSRASGSAASRPTTSSGLADSQHSRSLPPLAAVVSASLPSAPNQYQPPSSSGFNATSSQQQQQLHQHTQSIFQFQSTANDHSHRRPSTAYRPGTAPASASFFTFSDRSGLGSSSGRPDLSLLHSGFGGRPSSSTFGDQHYQHYQLGDPREVSTSPGNDPSPFYFNPPAATGASPVSLNPRKRTFGGPDGPFEDPSQLRADRPSSSAGFFGELNYEYGSESRPQSRRLTVMELCTDDKSPRPTSQRRDQHPPGSGAFLLSAAAPAGSTYGSTSSRPTTSSGLVSSTSTLRIFDRPTSPSAGAAFGQQSPHVPSRAPHATASANGDGNPTGSGRGTSEVGRGSGLPSASFSRVPPSTSSPFPVSATHSSSPTPTPTFTSPGILSLASSASGAFPDATFGGSQRGHHQYQQQQYQQSYPQHKRQHSSQYQLAHSPTFSSTSVSSNTSYSPRSPLSDSSSSSGSPFPSYAHPSARSSAVYAGGHAANSYATSGIPAQPHHHQHDGQVRASASPHPASFGMRV